MVGLIFRGKLALSSWIVIFRVHKSSFGGYVLRWDPWWSLGGTPRYVLFLGLSVIYHCFSIYLFIFYLSTYLLVYLSIYLHFSSIYVSTYSFIYLSTYPFCLLIYWSIYLYIYLSMYLYTSLYIIHIITLLFKKSHPTSQPKYIPPQVSRQPPTSPQQTRNRPGPHLRSHPPVAKVKFTGDQSKAVTWSLGTSMDSRWATKKKNLLLSIESWLVYRDPDIGLLTSLFKWVV